MIASVFMTNFLNKSLRNTRTAWVRDLDINKDFERSDFIKALKDFSQIYYYNYLSQLNDDCHTRKFQPFILNFTNDKDDAYSQDMCQLNLTIDERTIFNMVHNRAANIKDGLLKKDKIVFDDLITQKSKDLETGKEISVEKRFVDLLNETCSEIFNTRFKSN